MITFSNPPGAPVPASSYSQAALVEGPGKRLVISGQIGLAPDGSVPADGQAQIRQSLAQGGAGRPWHGPGASREDLTDTALVAPWRSLRDEALEGAAPTSTLLIVAGLASPKFLVEVEAEAFLSS